MFKSIHSTMPRKRAAANPNKAYFAREIKKTDPSFI
jgi:hypothetical protein